VMRTTSSGTKERRRVYYKRKMARNRPHAQSRIE
jgi:hypothetical protein